MMRIANRHTMLEGLWLLPPLLASLPLAMHLPLWILVGCAALWAWRLHLLITNRPLPSRGWRSTLALAAVAGILVQADSFIGRQAGVPLLVLLMFVKLLETETRPQQRLLLLLSHFLAMTALLFGQSLPLALYLLGIAVLNVAILARLQPYPMPALMPQISLSVKLFLAGIPLALMLFVFFPRLEHPLWALPSAEGAGRTGLSDQMRPGDISQLILSGEIAFRVQFAGPPPPPAQRYWRGPVLTRFDGQTWTALSSTPRMAAPARPVGAPRHYTLTLEPHDREWLFTLGLPTRIPPESRLGTGMQLVSLHPVNQRSRITIESAPTYYLGTEGDELFSALQLPESSNPRTLALARSWRDASRTPAQVMQHALDYYRAQFTYTLNPPRLGTNSVDEFLFVTRKGFCEHFAGSFVVLMRAAGIPARVVTGYQGGEINPIDQHLVVRQSDAHAWAEVWLDEQGWVQVDPTASVSPLRVERGVSAALPALEMPAGLARLQAPLLRTLRHGWEALNNGWNQWVLGYNHAQQLKLMSLLKPDRYHFSWLAMALLLIAGLGLLAWAIWQYRRPPEDAARALYVQFLKKLGRHGLVPSSGEGPEDFSARAAARHTSASLQIRTITRHYIQARYAEDPHALARLKQAVRAFSM